MYNYTTSRKQQAGLDELRFFLCDLRGRSLRAVRSKSSNRKDRKGFAKFAKMSSLQKLGTPTPQIGHFMQGSKRATRLLWTAVIFLVVVGIAAVTRRTLVLFWPAQFAGGKASP